MFRKGKSIEVESKLVIFLGWTEWILTVNEHEGSY